MTRGTERRLNTGMQVGGFIANLLQQLYNGYRSGQQRDAAGEAFQSWQSQNRTPGTAVQDPSGGVPITGPGGQEMTIPTFKTEGPKQGPVTADALASLYGAMAGVDPQYSQPYLEMGQTLYGANAADQRYQQQRSDQLEDRNYSRGIATEDRNYNREMTEDTRGFQTRQMIVDSLAGQNGKYDIGNPEALNAYLQGSGDLMQALVPRPEPVTPLGVIQGKGGVFVPTQQGSTFGGQSIKSDIPLRDPTAVYSGGGGGMTPTQKTSLSVYYANRDQINAQLNEISSQRQQLAQRERDAASIDATPNRLTGVSPRDKYLQELAKEAEKLNKAERDLRASAATLDARIQSWETGSVVRGGTQPSGPSATTPQNPW